jgi:diguanylate cyclase (GGDEF)-like protein/PAS domain S-box-containing protein
MSTPLRILLLEDSTEDAELVDRELRRNDLLYELRRVETKTDYLKALEEYDPQVILSDFALPQFDGLSALKLVRELRPSTPFIFVSGTLGETRAVESLKSGASDYVVKGDLTRLPAAISRALEDKRLRQEREHAGHLLRQSEEKFRMIAEQAKVGILLTDKEASVTYCNKHWRDVSGRTEEELRKLGWERLFHPNDKERLLGLMHKLLNDNQEVDVEYRILRPTGEVRWIRSRVTAQYDAVGVVTGYMDLMIDNTEHVRAEQKIQRLSRIRDVLSAINSTIVRTVDREQLCRDACDIAVSKGNFRLAWLVLADAATGMISQSAYSGMKTVWESKRFLSINTSLRDASVNAYEVVASGKARIVNDIEDPRYEKHTSDPHHSRIATLQKVGINSMVYLPLRLGEKTYGVLVLGAELKNYFTEEEMRLLQELADDIAFSLDHLEKAEKLNYLAYYDPLTELPNRTQFFTHLQQHLFDMERSSGTVAVAAIDIERFRYINESFGEGFGDSLLKAVADRLLNLAGNPRYLGRIGGDSFAFFSPQSEDVATLASRLEHSIQKWVAKPFKVNDREIVAGIKMGIALFPSDGSKAEVLFQNASAALKAAKKSGERIVYYAKEINARVAERLHLEDRLRHALNQREFVLHYQPKVDLTSNAVHSMEALIRWNDPDRGLIAPGEFIPILEETGLIYDVGLWALQQAFEDGRRMREHFSVAPSIAVNVSALQLQRKTFHDEILGVISAAADGNHGLEIEITESLIMRDMEDNIRKLREVRNSNVPIAVDDFGTGYSSLAYIAKLPIDILKVDQSFVSAMTTSPDDMAIVTTIITLAHALDLKVVAEGVETEEQAQMLRRLKCDEAQGYLFCRPIPYGELISRLALNGTQLMLKPTPD